MRIHIPIHMDTQWELRWKGDTFSLHLISTDIDSSFCKNPVRLLHLSVSSSTMNDSYPPIRGLSWICIYFLGKRSQEVSGPRVVQRCCDHRGRWILSASVHGTSRTRPSHQQVSWWMSLEEGVDILPFRRLVEVSCILLCCEETHSLHQRRHATHCPLQARSRRLRE